MTKLNWERVRRERTAPDLPQMPAPPPRARLPRSRLNELSPFKAKFPGWCANCHKPFGQGALIRYNAANRIVHSGGCPKKR